MDIGTASGSINSNLNGSLSAAYEVVEAAQSGRLPGAYLTREGTPTSQRDPAGQRDLPFLFSLADVSSAALHALPPLLSLGRSEPEDAVPSGLVDEFEARRCFDV